MAPRLSTEERRNLVKRLRQRAANQPELTSEQRKEILRAAHNLEAAIDLLALRRECENEMLSPEEIEQLRENGRRAGKYGHQQFAHLRSRPGDKG